jgi:hypothetical protein
VSMYSESIAQALPGADPADYEEIENIMREHILHSELDWVQTDLFRETAQLAYELLLTVRTQQTGRTETPVKRKRRR